MITLGLNYSQMHDSSACLVRDGELLFAVAEERSSRLKHDARFPALAIQTWLDLAYVDASHWIDDDALFADPLHISEQRAAQFSQRFGRVLGPDITRLSARSAASGKPCP